MKEMVKKSLRKTVFHNAARGAIVFLGFQIALLGGVPGARADGVESAGDVLAVALPLFAGGLTLTKRDENGAWDKQGLWQFVQSYGVTVGLTFALKAIIDSERPNHRDNDSFPSGHTSSAMSAASFMDHRYGWKYGLPAYALAGFVAYSRVDADEHHPRDVIAGALLAWGVDHVFTNRYVTAAGVVRGDGALLRLKVNF